MQVIVFSNLDGALLDEDYSSEIVDKTISELKKRGIPLVICTSKTRGEIEIYTKELGIKHPFISENGGAIFIPKGYFDFKFNFDREDKNYKIIELGTPSSMLIDVMEKIKKGYNIKSFHDMTAEDLAKDARLPIERAKRAKEREYDIAFKIIEPGAEERIRQVINDTHLQFVKGARYWHLLGNNDKGKAVEILLTLLQRKYNDIKTIAIGTSPNDFPMLDIVDRPYLVKLPNNTHTSEKYIKAWAIGPEGWLYAIKEELGF